MREFDLKLHQDHPIVRAGRRSAIIDTGSPMTMRTPPIVGDALGIEIPWLVGNDFLRRHRVLFDWGAGRLRLGGDPIHGDAVELTECMGVYLAPLDTPLGRTQAVLDTGAQLTYGPRRVVAGLTPCGTRTDFHPLLNAPFEVELYEVRLRFAGRSYDAKVGVLPEALSSLLSLIGVEWILGTDVLKQRAIQLDLASSRLIAESPRPVRRGGGGGGMPLLLRIIHDQERERRLAPARVVSAPVTGWRGWRLFENDSGRPQLRSLTADVEWNGPVEVSDRDPRHAGERSGIHCYATPGGLSRLSDAVVYGEVSLFGIVCVHETGYRAERARIDRLYLRSCGRARAGNPRRDYCGCRELEPAEWSSAGELHRIADSLSRTYQCEVIIDHARARTILCRTHRPIAQARRPRHVTDRQPAGSNPRRSGPGRPGSVAQRAGT